MATEYRFIVRPNCYTIYRKGEILWQKGRKVFRAIPPLFDEKKPCTYPISICKKEEDLTDKERLDILADWNGPTIHPKTGEPTGIEREYSTIEELVKALRCFQYDEGEV